MLKSYFWEMDKRLFPILIALMTLSLLGIVFVQLYWIYNAYNAKEEQFSQSVKQALTNMARDVQMREINDYFRVYNALADSANIPDRITFSEFADLVRNGESNERLVFSGGPAQENYKRQATFPDVALDSLTYQKFVDTKKTTQVKNNPDGGIMETNPEIFDEMREFQFMQFESVFKNLSATTPIHKRVSTQEIETALNKRLREQDIQTPFEYAVYSNNVVTKVHSENFNLDPSSTYPIPLFANENSRRNYEFFVNFPKKDPEVINTILGMILLSLIFMAVIILAYSTALRQLLRQQQISQIKTDFINNMTHEFKTPIATINLALDAIKNPIVVGNEAFLKRYHGMIREENKRMLVQVENMLRISKLEKNELDLTKVRIQLHDVIEVAITHLQLIVENRKGYIKTYFNAVECTILGNESHLTNVIVNMLDNAVKYSEGTPKIDVYTENVKDFIVLKIRDQGLGMTKQVQKKIFEKFYREHTGNVHNVKGHGLGLAYVKWILKDHGAEISVQSEKGKGSTFIIKTRLIA